MSIWFLMVSCKTQVSHKIEAHKIQVPLYHNNTKHTYDFLICNPKTEKKFKMQTLTFCYFKQNQCLEKPYLTLLTKNLNAHCIEYACKIAYIPSHKQKMICMCNKISTDPAKN